MAIIKQAKTQSKVSLLAVERKWRAESRSSFDCAELGTSFWMPVLSHCIDVSSSGADFSGLWNSLARGETVVSLELSITIP